MSVVPNSGNGKITVPDLLRRKTQAAGSDSNFQKITCLTAYDYPTARLLDEAGVDVILVGDSLGMVVLGHESTLPVTIDEMLHHTRAVRRGTHRALLVADMPYGSYHTDMAESLHNAMRFVKEAGAEAVKVEGGERRLDAAIGECAGRISRARKNTGCCRAVDSRCARGGSGGGFCGCSGGGASRAGGADYARIAHPDDRHRRRPGLRWADSCRSRSSWSYVWPDAEICAAVCQRRGNHREGREGILRRCARGDVSIRWRVLSCGADGDRTERGAG